MSETETPTKPAMSQPFGNQYGTLSEKLTFWARFATHSQMRLAITDAARVIATTESKSKGK